MYLMELSRFCPTKVSPSLCRELQAAKSDVFFNSGVERRPGLSNRAGMARTSKASLYDYQNPQTPATGLVQKAAAPLWTLARFCACMDTAA
ncbi:hypothetical protein AV530_006273 [Patagioenas fasciata monilis]|uniref:Uncharacterized protein n=1 Tax=Patagioenas fasciata monilis TaxID=372326 RepID=A0A1V4KG41_PATFA|nr:hypothetical protein AV530_006273 [Patagioenas fasciata monilis]